MSKLAVVRGIRQFFFKTKALYFNKLTCFYEAVLLCGRAVANRSVLNFSLFRTSPLDYNIGRKERKI